MGSSGPHLQLGWKSCGLFQSHGHIQQKLRGRPGTEGLYTFGHLRGEKNMKSGEIINEWENRDLDKRNTIWLFHIAMEKSLP